MKKSLVNELTPARMKELKFLVEQELKQVKALLRSQKVYNYVLYLLGSHARKGVQSAPVRVVSNKEVKRRLYDAKRLLRCMGNERLKQVLKDKEVAELRHVKCCLRNNPLLLRVVLTYVAQQDGLKLNRHIILKAQEKLQGHTRLYLGRSHQWDKISGFLTGVRLPHQR